MSLVVGTRAVRHASRHDEHLSWRQVDGGILRVGRLPAASYRARQSGTPCVVTSASSSSSSRTAGS